MKIQNIQYNISNDIVRVKNFICYTSQLGSCEKDLPQILHNKLLNSDLYQDLCEKDSAWNFKRCTYPDYEAIDFKGYDLKNNPIYAACILENETMDIFVLRFGNLCHAQIWLDAEMILDRNIHLNDSEFIIYPLESGLHTIIAKISDYSNPYAFEYDVNRSASFSIRITPYAMLEVENSEKLFMDYVNTQVKNSVYLVSDSDVCLRKKNYYFQIMTRDFTTYQKQAEGLFSIKNRNGQILDQYRCLIFQRHCIPLYIYRNQPNCEFLIIEMEACHTAVSYYLQHTIQISSERLLVQRLERQVNTYKKQYPLEFLGDVISFANIDGRLEIIKKLGVPSRFARPIFQNHPSEFLKYYTDIVKILDCFDQLLTYKQYLIKNKGGTCFFLSKLDGQYDMFNISFPQNYSENIAYPVILIIGMCRYSWYTRYYKKYFKNIPAIFVDLSTRGYTLGNQIGQAAFFEVLSLIMDLFQINFQRMYLIGYTSGGYTAFALAQLYPNLFAGLAIIGGKPNKEGLVSLLNQNILVVSGEQDKFYFDTYVNPYQILSKYRLHPYERILVKKADDNTLERILYSRKIIEWLLSQLKCTNDYVGLSALWLKEKQTHRGLLDVYRAPVAVLISKKSQSAYVQELAYKYAHPRTTGYESEVYVDYPIVNVDFFQKDLLPSQNCIYIGLFSDYASVGITLHPYKFFDTYFFYNNIKYVGEYCIAFIQYNEIKSDLYVVASSNKYLKKFCIHRSFIMPSYCCSQNSLFSYSALWLVNTKYFYIGLYEDQPKELII